MKPQQRISGLEEPRSIQFRMSWLLASPLIVSPFFLGLSTGSPLAGWDFDGEVLHVAVVLLLYVIAYCWLAIRHLDRLNEFRRFPFRGSLLLGGIAGVVFTAQFGYGMIAAQFMNHFDELTPELILIQLVGTVFTSILAGGLLGLYFGLVAGGLYCGLRFLVPSRSQVIPLSRRRRRW